jgi:hypothetical protein
LIIFVLLPTASSFLITSLSGWGGGMHAEVGKVNLKSNGDEALNDEFLLKSNGDEALNDGFP